MHFFLASVRAASLKRKSTCSWSRTLLAHSRSIRLFEEDAPGRTLKTIKHMLRTVGILLVIYIVLVAIIYFRQRSILYFPSHATISTALVPWLDAGHTIGYCRQAPIPDTIWLMMHGNAGQAADRDYVLHCMSEKDALYVLEYPGYGSREGNPSLQSMNQAASKAYQLLRSRNPNTPVCVLGESVGSGPACALALPPDKIVLVVPFDSLVKVASRHYPFLPVRYMLRDAWDNVESLKHYAGPVEIFGATGDSIIPIEHARALASRIPNSRFHAIEGGHNDWSEDHRVRIQR